jgi:hypothetical protein
MPELRAAWAWARAMAHHGEHGLSYLTVPTAIRFVQHIRHRQLPLVKACYDLVSRRLEAALAAGDVLEQEGVWWIILAMARMLLRIGKRGGRGRGSRGAEGGGPTAERCHRFLNGDWPELWAEAVSAEQQAVQAWADRRTRQAAAVEARGGSGGLSEEDAVPLGALRKALKLAELGQHSHAMSRVASRATPAPGTAATLEALEALHPTAGALSAGARAGLRADSASITATYSHVRSSGSGGGASATRRSSEGGDNSSPGSNSGSDGQDGTPGDGLADMDVLPDADDLLPRAPFAFPRDLQLHLDKDTLRQALASAPRGAAPGGSGLVSDILRDLALSGLDGLEIVHRLLQPVARGTLPDTVANALGASVLTGLHKPGSPTLRPIGVGEAIRRMAARGVVRQFSARIRNHFTPLQYSAETKAGAQQVFIALRAHVERALAAFEPVLVIRVDAKNAFNCLARKGFFSELRTHFPELLPGIAAFYVRDGALHVRCEDGTVHTLRSSSGVTQGDVYGPFLFALGIHPILIRTMERFGGRGVYVLAFADDIHLVGPPQATWEAFCYLRSELKREANLDMSPGKCSAYSPGGAYPSALRAEAAKQDSAMIIKQDGFIVLGVPFHVGRPGATTSDHLVKRFNNADNARSLISCLRGLVDLAHHGGPHGRFAASKLLRICIPGKTTYFSQLVYPSDAAAAGKWAAAEISKAWLSIMGGDAINASEMESYGAWREQLRAAPVALGGEGLTSLADTAELAFFGAAFAFMPAVRERAALCAARWGCDPALPDRLFGAACYGVRAAPPADQPLLPFQSILRELRTVIATRLSASSLKLDFTEEDGAQRDLQRHLTQAHFEAQRPMLRCLVQAEEDATGNRGWLLQRFDAGVGYAYGAWLSSLAGSFHHSLTGEEYCCAARRHLSLSFPELRSAPLCPHCRKHRLDEYGAHVLACEEAGALDNEAHNLVRDTLYRACKEAGFNPGKEPPGLVPGTRQRPADVLLSAGQHGIGGHAHSSTQACLDCTGVRSECASHMCAGLPQSMAAAHARKVNRHFEPSAAAHIAAATAGDKAALESAAAGGSSADVEAAREAARQRALEARRPRPYVVPVVFSSCGCWYNGEPQRGLRAVMDTLAAKFKSGDSDRPDGVGAATVQSRWLPQLSTALERGIWWRYRRMFRALRGDDNDDHLAVGDLPSYVVGRLFMAAS